jgi:hypothetical protein
MVEFALIFPLLLILAVSLADYGYYIEHVDNVDTIVRDGARFASLNSANLEPWTSACTTPTWDDSSHSWSCAGASSTWSAASCILTDVSIWDYTSNCTLTVSSTTGFPNPATLQVNTTGGTGTALLSCSIYSTTEFEECTAASGSGLLVSSNNAVEGSSDYVESLLQQEGESLSVPEGGLSLDNVDCLWNGASQPLTSPGSTSGVSIPSGYLSCMTIAYYRNPSSDSSYASPTLQGWAEPSCSAPYYENYNSGSPECVTTSSDPSIFPEEGDLVQVTVVYDYSQQAPGPAFTVLNSVYNLQGNVVGQYSMVVTS